MSVICNVSSSKWCKNGSQAIRSAILSIIPLHFCLRNTHSTEIFIDQVRPIIYCVDAKYLVSIHQWNAHFELNLLVTKDVTARMKFPCVFFTSLIFYPWHKPKIPLSRTQGGKKLNKY